MRSLLLGGAVAFALAGVAGAQDHSKMNHGVGGPAPEATGATLPTPDYITAAGQSDQFEVQEGKLAQAQGKSPSVKSFGTMMVREHTKTTSQLMATLKGMGMTPPPPPPLRADQQAMIAELSSKTGDDFDRTYVQQQLMSHQEALSVQTGYAAGGEDAKLKKLATTTAPIVQSHINSLRTMQTKMGR